MSRKRKLNEEELVREFERNWFDSSDEEPFPESESEYEPSNAGSEPEAGEKATDDLTEEEAADDLTASNRIEVSNIEWSECDDHFLPRLSLPLTEILAFPTVNLDRSAKELDVFFKLFPKSLLLYIAQGTNSRLTKHAQSINKVVKHTDSAEIALVIGTLLVMCYHRVPNFHCYWSTNKTMGNEALKAAISRDRFTLLHSKLYFSEPEKPTNCSKTYYIDDLMACLKGTFQKCRTDSQHQAIDEAMAKFKGRSSLKQYLPFKPIKRGIKLWVICDSDTGYTYDINIYVGKETEAIEGTLGERVVKKLCQTITDPKVTLCFDRFFTSINLLNDLKFCAVGTCMSNRKHMPVFEKNLVARGDNEMLASNIGVLGSKWKDTKDVIVVSNCHRGKLTTIVRKNREGGRDVIACPESILFYNKHMGGVDLADQLANLYDINRKSQKWWKKVFYRMLLQVVVNAWILYKELTHKKVTMLQFIVPLAEQLIDFGRKEASNKRRRQYGRASTSSFSTVKASDHMPIKAESRRRCNSCHKKGIQKRTNIVCSHCNIALCIDCFQKYHT